MDVKVAHACIYVPRLKLLKIEEAQFRSSVKAQARVAHLWNLFSPWTEVELKWTKGGKDENYHTTVVGGYKWRSGVWPLYSTLL